MPSARFEPRGRVRALAYRALWSSATLFQKAASASVHVAAGLLRQKDLKSASQTLWADYCLENEAVDAGLEAWEQRMFDRVLRPSDTVLLIGCGAGRDLLALKELGYDVTGLDPATGIVEHALGHLARRGMTARVISGFVEDTDPHDTYDVIVFAGSCYSFVQGRTRRVSTLTRLHARLAEGGRIALTYARRGQRTPSTHWLTRMTARLARADWRPERGDVFGRLNAVPGIVTYDHVFAPGEVAQECASAGLRVVCDEDASAMPWVVAVPESRKSGT